MDRKTANAFGLALTVALTVEEIHRYRQRRKAHREAVAALNNVKERLTQFWVDMEFERIVYEMKS
jgi:hypothetical protein